MNMLNESLKYINVLNTGETPQIDIILGTGATGRRLSDNDPTTYNKK